MFLFCNMFLQKNLILSSYALSTLTQRTRRFFRICTSSCYHSCNLFISEDRIHRLKKNLLCETNSRGKRNPIWFVSSDEWRILCHSNHFRWYSNKSFYRITTGFFLLKWTAQKNLFSLRQVSFFYLPYRRLTYFSSPRWWSIIEQYVQIRSFSRLSNQ